MNRQDVHLIGERILLVGCGDLGMRVAIRLLSKDSAWNDSTSTSADESSTAGRPGTPPVSLWALRRQPPAAAAAGAGPAAWAIPASIQWLQGEVTQPRTLANLPAGVTRLVYVLTPGARTEAAYRAVFLDGLRHVLNALDTRALRRLIFVSSSAVYGDHDGAWIDESTPPSPLGMNGAVLLQAEQWLAAQGLPAVSLRLAGLYGPGRLQLIDRLRAGQVRVPRDVPHWANRMHADDAAAAIAHLLMLPKADDIYLGADDTPLPLDTLYDYLAALTDSPLPAAGPAPAGVGSKRLLNTRLRDTGFELAWPDARPGYAALLAPAH